MKAIQTKNLKQIKKTCLLKLLPTAITPLPAPTKPPLRFLKPLSDAAACTLCYIFSMSEEVGNVPIRSTTNSLTAP
jgi:hypothetical protein